MSLCKMGISIFCTLMVFLCLLEPMVAVKMGPFKATYARAGPCDSPTLPLDPDPATFFYAELYNSTTDVKLLRGNVTIIKEHKIKKMKAKSLVWENDKWKVSYLINNMGCHRVFFPILCRATGVKYDPKTCHFYKGEYIFENFNINNIEHFWMSNQEYGRVLWRLEVFSQIGSMFCYEFETLIEPI